MDVVIPQPELPQLTAEAPLVRGPVAIEIHGAVAPSLEHLRAAGGLGAGALHGSEARGPPYGGEALWLRGHPGRAPGMAVRPRVPPRGGPSPQLREGETGGQRGWVTSPTPHSWRSGLPLGPTPTLQSLPNRLCPIKACGSPRPGPGGRGGLTGGSGHFDNGHTIVSSLRADELLCGIPGQSPLCPRTTGPSPGRRHSRSTPRRPCPCRTARSAAGSRAGRRCTSRSGSHPS